MNILIGATIPVYYVTHIIAKGLPRYAECSPGGFEPRLVDLLGLDRSGVEGQRLFLEAWLLLSLRTMDALPEPSMLEFRVLGSYNILG